MGSLTVLGPPKAQGRWSLVEADLPLGDVTPTQRQHALATALLDRHGVLTREAVRGEGHPRGFAGVYPVLRAMEESGRCRRGYFVAGLGGAQFALPGAVDRLRADRRDSPKGALVLAATDPANVYGLSLPWPERPGAGSRPVNGPDGWPGPTSSSSTACRASTWRRAPRASSPSARSTAPGRTPPWPPWARWSAAAGLRRLSIERYDDGMEPVLRAAGFVPTPRGLVRYGA